MGCREDERYTFQDCSCTLLSGGWHGYCSFPKFFSSKSIQFRWESWYLKFTLLRLQLEAMKAFSLMPHFGLPKKQPTTKQPTTKYKLRSWHTSPRCALSHKQRIISWRENIPSMGMTSTLFCNARINPCFLWQLALYTFLSCGSLQTSVGFPLPRSRGMSADPIKLFCALNSPFWLKVRGDGM